MHHHAWLIPLFWRRSLAQGDSNVRERTYPTQREQVDGMETLFLSGHTVSLSFGYADTILKQQWLGETSAIRRGFGPCHHQHWMYQKLLSFMCHPSSDSEKFTFRQVLALLFLYVCH
jgi:hypothetical protein